MTDDDGKEQILIRILDNLILQIQSSIKFRSQPVIPPRPKKKNTETKCTEMFYSSCISDI